VTPVFSLGVFRKGLIMQYPPQQPANQPSYAPAEMVMQEQLQTLPPMPVYAPQNGQFAPGQEIVVYAKRTQAIVRVTICVIALLVLILLIPTMLIVGFVTSGAPAPGDIPPLIFAFVIILAGIAFISWITWRTASDFLFNRQPVLRINHEGITVGKVPMLSGYSISWAEIGAVFSSRYLYKYFCILPKNPDEYLARFKGLDRFNRRMNSVIGAPLYMPQTYLDRPIEEIINAIYAGYVNELAQNRVQLRP
jgi:hypothetical protein